MGSTSGMIQARKEDSAKKVEAVMRVLDRYCKKHIPLNLQAIAREADVSVKFLYSNPVVNERIKELQGMPANTSAENLDVVIKSLKKQLDEKQKIIDQLSSDINLNYKELYEQEKARRIELENQLMERYDPFTGLPKAG